MVFTKNQIRELPEDRLRKEVLVPLFRASGFCDVKEYHGGPQEQGKDIVMWKHDQLRGRVNIAVVAKATKITGQAAGKSSASEVCFQIQQAFGSPYRDPTTGEERTVKECIVVSSKEILKEAIQSIQSSLKSVRLDDRIIFWDGDKLWSQVEERFPKSSALEKVHEIQKHFENIDPFYRIAVDTSGGKARFSIEPKSAATEGQPPLKLGIKLKFSDDADRRKRFEELEKHLRTGSPVIIPRGNIAGIRCPEVLKALFGDGSRFAGLQLGPRKDDRVYFVKFEAFANDGSSAVLDFVELRTLHIGTDEVTLSNDHQDLPWTVTLAISRSPVGTKGKLHVCYRNKNVHQVLQAARFQKVISQPSTVRVVDVATGLEWTTLAFEPSASVPPLDDSALEFLKELDFIQSRIEAPIAMPNRPITEAEADGVIRIAEILKTGKLIYPIESLTGTADRGFAQEVCKFFSHSSVCMSLKTACLDDVVVEVFDQKVVLGKSMDHCPKVFLAQEHLLELQRELGNQDKSRFEITFTAAEDSPLEQYFPRWMPKAEAELIEKQMQLPSALQGHEEVGRTHCSVSPTVNADASLGEKLARDSREV